MELKVSDLKRFQKASKHIQSNGALPIHNYIKLEPGKITKIVTGAFVEFPCDSITDTVLVDEKMLNGLLNTTQAPIISISINKDRCVISDGDDKPYFPLQNASVFSDTPSPTSEIELISSEFLEGMGMAAKVAKTMETIPHYLMYVLVGKNSICGGDGFMAIHYPIEENMQIILEKKISLFLSKENISSFAYSENHYFFYTPDGITFGFSRQNIGYTDLSGVIVAPSEKKISFSATSSDISSFNSYAMQMSKDCFVTIANNKIYWSDDLTGIGNHRDRGNLTVEEPYTFNPSRMNAIISALGCKELDFYDGPGLYYIKSHETKASAIVAKINIK